MNPIIITPLIFEEVFTGLGFAVSSTLVVTCCHVVAERVPAHPHFKRSRIEVNGLKGIIVAMGQDTPFEEDIAFVRVKEGNFNGGLEMKLTGTELYRVHLHNYLRLSKSVFSITPSAFDRGGQGFILSRHRVTEIQNDKLGLSELFGRPGMSGSPILGIDTQVHFSRR